MRIVVWISGSRPLNQDFVVGDHLPGSLSLRAWIALERSWLSDDMV